MCVGIVWTEISSEKKIFVQTRTKIHFWRTKKQLFVCMVSTVGTKV